MNRMEFERAVEEMAAQFAEMRYSMSALGLFLTFCRSVSRRLPETGPGPDVPTAIEAYVAALEEKGVSRKVCSAHRRHARYITSFLETGHVDFSYAKRLWRDPIGGEFDNELAAYIDDMRGRGLAEATVTKWSGYTYRFLSHLRERGLSSLADVGPEDISEFVTWASALHAASGMAGELTMLRSVLSFAEARGLVRGTGGWVPRGRGLRSAPVASFTDDEVARVIKAIDNTTAMGKRDLAIIMLAAGTGIRSSEIVALRLADVGWEDGTVTVRRAKAPRTDVLPVGDATLAAIADYVLHGRPESGCDEVFLVHHAPYEPFAHGHSLHKMTKRYYDAAGITGRAGLHRMRHTAATGLLRSGATADTIAAALGHSKVENAVSYVTFDVEGLRSCCLGLPKGGDSR